MWGVHILNTDTCFLINTGLYVWHCICMLFCLYIWTSVFRTENGKPSADFWILCHCVLSFGQSSFCMFHEPIGCWMLLLKDKAGVILYFSYAAVYICYWSDASLMVMQTFQVTIYTELLHSTVYIVDFFKKRLSIVLKQLGTVVFSECYSNRSTECICWELLSATD